MTADELLEEYSRYSHTFRIMDLLPEEYDELVEGQSRPMDTPERLEDVSRELIDWFDGIDEF